MHQHHWKGYGFAVIILHILGITLLLSAMRTHPEFLGFGFLAYTLGLRHAFDADHIAAIDNTVRKLSQENRNPSGVGLYFSLGHSTVVMVMALITAAAAKWAVHSIPRLSAVGSLIGASVSGLFLLFIGVINLIALIQICLAFRKMRQSPHDASQIDRLLQSRGMYARLLKPFFRMVNRGWQVYPIGFLFGLGFDTASEVALLAVSAGAAQHAVPWTGILSFALLFASGMSLLDTADGLFMTRAYRWALHTPLRNAYYNVIVTGISVIAALGIGLLELIQAFASKFGLHTGFWKWVLNFNMGNIGYVLLAVFALVWLLSYAFWKYSRIGKRWGRDNVSS